MAPSEAHKFIFDQDITLKVEGGREAFDIMINIYSDKGAKYVTGLLKLQPVDLKRAEGETVVVALTKCLDNDAYC